jgi:hypothetical protein
MQDQSYFPLGNLDGTEVGVQSTLDGQDILIQRSEIGRNLANLLAGSDVQFLRQGDAYYWRIAHSRQVDDLLVELIDLLVSIRYAHPALVQLELALPVPSAVEGSDSEGIVLEPDEP